MYLYRSSTLSILSNTTVCWESNHANLGGAISVFNNPFIYCTELTRHIPIEQCFFQLPGQNLSDGIDIQLVFKNNSADDAGSVLYGGAIDNCKIIGPDSYSSSEVFDMLVQYQADDTPSSISSDPFRILPCEKNHPSWFEFSNTLHLSAYPGETFQVSVVSLGQRNGIVPAAVRSHIRRGRLLSSQYVQQTNKLCTTLTYTVFSQQNVELDLYADSPCSTFGDRLHLQLNINQTCPPGFNISQDECACICDQVLQKYTNHCNITDGLGQLTRESDDTFWIGYDQYHGPSIHTAPQTTVSVIQ